MAAGDLQIVYGAAIDASITLASLASDTNLLAGRESAAIVNTTDKWTDFGVSGRIRTGTSPTASRVIEVWAVGSWDGTLWPDTVDGTDSAITLSGADIKQQICMHVAIMQTTNASNRDYPFSIRSLAAIFGGIIPPAWAIFVTHNTGVALNATGSNHRIRIQPLRHNVSP